MVVRFIESGTRISSALFWIILFSYSVTGLFYIYVIYGVADPVKVLRCPGITPINSEFKQRSILSKNQY